MILSGLECYVNAINDKHTQWYDLWQLHLIGTTQQSIQMCQKKAVKNMEHVSRKSHNDC